MIYLDHNATTPIDPAVAEKMAGFLREQFGNPSSLYPIGRRVKELMNEARERVAAALGADRGEIYFTGSGTEADNFAIFGTFDASPDRNEFVTSAIEHPAVIESARALERRGIKVTYLPVDEYGTISLDHLRSALTPRTALVSIMHANNEIGTIQPLAEIVRIAREAGVPVHTDAVQSFGKIDVDAHKLGVDLLTVSAHKIYGPKGVGALYVRRGEAIAPFVHGGHQERGLRAGTENTAGIIGFGEAVRVMADKGRKERARIEKLAEALKRGIEEKIPGARFNGHPEHRVKSTLNFAFPGLEAEAILLALATKEIYVSTGSACSEESEEVSHVLRAIGLRPEIARSCIRMSLGRSNSEEDVAVVLRELPEIIARLRSITNFHPEG
ncbi:MAG TPA: aminotransferase class V-fold PLP-dependent enzyme [Candidatus Aminicenantes bacterium]|nr:aminotransferase class V-fold PLP-dependent enzyme [Candidatus Aminicenantes bacterium]HRY65205.1 aminotransferase class V-fold PLP-dependent enzyme [Candidatus Aminicenantes bacterium]HRZ72327.1 aminotransferase class V-fold PLP-dependent enzyme [Candidatus Aminicenantes bacterium]